MGNTQVEEEGLNAKFEDDEEEGRGFFDCFNSVNELHMN